jgi:hypothetical protein
VNNERISVQNHSNYDATSGVAFIHIQYVTSFTTDYVYAVEISGREKTNTDCCLGQNITEVARVLKGQKFLALNVGHLQTKIQ